MPWKDRYTISDERSMADAALRWPDGHRLCMTVTVDLSLATTPEGISAADLTTPVAYFATHEGLDQLLTVLARHRIQATFAVPAVMARLLADRLRAIAASGHEIAAHGFRHEDVSALGRDDERARIRRTTEIIAEIAGHRPSGWYSLPRQTDRFATGSLSAHTVDLLIDEGYAYLGNGLADDIPHWWVTDFASRRALLTLPYNYHHDDQFFCMFPVKGTGLENPAALARNWRTEFEAQYRRGRQFSMMLHPQHSGWAQRLALLDSFLGHARSVPGVLNMTAERCASWWRNTYPAETHLILKPSIWKDYPGSLS
jgi:peptidoglycan/xylan/chitin deacetylase (PgdA/CDA1 family)